MCSEIANVFEVFFRMIISKRFQSSKGECSKGKQPVEVSNEVRVYAQPKPSQGIISKQLVLLLIILLFGGIVNAIHFKSP